MIDRHHSSLDKELNSEPHNKQNLSPIALGRGDTHQGLGRGQPACPFRIRNLSYTDSAGDGMGEDCVCCSFWDARFLNTRLMEDTCNTRQPTLLKSVCVPRLILRLQLIQYTMPKFDYLWLHLHVARPNTAEKCSAVVCIRSSDIDM